MSYQCAPQQRWYYGLPSRHEATDGPSLSMCVLSGWPEQGRCVAECGDPGRVHPEQKILGPLDEGLPNSAANNLRVRCLSPRSFRGLGSLSYACCATGLLPRPVESCTRTAIVLRFAERGRSPPGGLSATPTPIVRGSGVQCTVGVSVGSERGTRSNPEHGVRLRKIRPISVRYGDSLRACGLTPELAFGDRALPGRAAASEKTLG